MRPDEAWRLEFRDVTVADDEDLGKTILEIEVRGKRGGGYCKAATRMLDNGNVCVTIRNDRCS